MLEVLRKRCPLTLASYGARLARTDPVISQIWCEIASGLQQNVNQIDVALELLFFIDHKVF